MLRVLRFNNRSVTEVQLQFSGELDPGIGVSNVSIRSSVPNIPDLIVKSVRVNKAVISITTSPQTPLALYVINLISTDAQDFQGKDGERLEPNSSFFFIGQEKSNDVRESILNSLPSVYDTDQETFVRKHISNLADVLLRGRTDVRETGNANFLSVDVKDETLLRGHGPTDRLSNEGVFQILRVSDVPEGSTQIGTVLFNESLVPTTLGVSNLSKANLSLVGFPTDPYPLRGVRIFDEVVSHQSTTNNKFDGTLVSLSNKNVAILYSVHLTKEDGTKFVYDLPKYGYAIANNRYDETFGRNLFTLESNQIKLSDDAVLSGTFSEPVPGDELRVSYLYVDSGLNVNTDAVLVSQVKKTSREVVSPLLTIFNLKHYPVVLQNDTIPELGGVQFLDPSPLTGTPFTKTHPAFLSEIVFDSSSLPSEPGEYSVDYSTGRVFVFGATTNDGTGNGPPVASYYYRKVYADGIDYNLSQDDDEIVAVSGRDLMGAPVKVSYEYERVFSEGIDYSNESHVEVINEYVENRLENSFKLATKNGPITNVFEIFNETTGETYSITRYNDNYVYFNGINLPRIVSKTNEDARFDLVTNETLFVIEQIQAGADQIFKIQLRNNEIVTSTGKKRGANANGDIEFSNGNIFAREYFYDNTLQTVGVNLEKLSSVGDYLVNYKDGIVYVRVADSQSLDVGSVSYRHGRIIPSRDQVLSADRITYKPTQKSDDVLALDVDSTDSTYVEIKALPDAIERFYNDNTDKPILLGTVQSGSAGQMFPGSFEFVAPDAEFDDSFADGYHILRIVGEPDRGITSVTSGRTLIVDTPFTELNRKIPWYIIDFNLQDGYSVVTSYNIDYVNAVYTVTDLQTNDKDSLTNLYDPRVDTFVANKITFNNDLIKSVPAGTALAIDYSFGNMWLDYTYLVDRVRVSYEYGDNSLNFSLSDKLEPNDEYFVSYRYGALRNKLLENFGSLTQIDDLTTFPLDFDRELYRRFLIGSLQAFVNGPTNSSIRTLVKSVTDIEPEIVELTFDEWTVGRDNLYLEQGLLDGTERYDSGKFEKAIVIDGDTTLKYPSEAYLSYREGSFEAWATPNWSGIDNDATLIVDVDSSPSEVFIGSTGYSPTEIPFSVSRLDPEPLSAVGKPSFYPKKPGHYIWFDDSANNWNWSSTTDGMTTITTSGEMYNVGDGYSVTSTSSYIRIDGYEDGLDGTFNYDGYDGYQPRMEFTFNSDDLHYLWDSGPSLYDNRMSIFKDGSGYLNFRIYDDSGRKKKGRPRQYAISTNIQDWVAREPRFISASWRLNSSEGIDEMHLFVDGQEVSNLFKYGGRPQGSPTSVYRTVAEEVIETSASKPILGGSNGSSQAGSTTFTAFGSQFVSSGIVVGDALTILDGTADGVGGPYTVTGVGEDSLSLSSALTLTLDNINFSVNQATYTVDTNVDVEKFAVFVEDGYGSTAELRGVEAESPDYSIKREASENTIFINNGVEAGDKIYITTLGLTKGRCRDIVFTYEDGYSLQSRGSPPASLSHFDAFKYFMRRTSIEAGTNTYVDGYFDIVGNQADGYFYNICHPSNTVRGKTVSAVLGGTDNIDFGGTNTITIFGDTYSGATSETLTFSDYGVQTTTEFFTSISQVDMSFTAMDTSKPLGSIELLESQPFTVSEGGGDYAQVASYNNGVFEFVYYGSGGVDFPIEGGCYYRLDYPISLSIPMTHKGTMYIGSSMEGKHQWDGSIDQVALLSEMLDDVRAGEEKNDARTFTMDFNSPVPLSVTPQTLMLLNFDGNLNNVQEFYKSFDEKMLTSSRSVNPEFGDAIVIRDNNHFIIDNGPSVFNQNLGTVEFWINPLMDSLYDANDRYFVDTTSIRLDKVSSDTAITLKLPLRAKRVVSVRLVDDTGEGVDFFEGGQLLADGRSIILGTRLPRTNTVVQVKYVPIDANGDRFSIYKDKSGNLNFSIIANDQLYMISYPIDWRRNTWHRVVATWKTNTVNNVDRMRLFIDGAERGTITWGTPGLLYGAGVIYGSAAVGSAGSNALVANIDLTDTFGDIHIGNSFDNENPAMVKLDNLRFSNIVREPSVVAGSAIDINYNSNVDTVLPVVEDNFTTAIYDFNRATETTKLLSNLYSKYTPLFRVDVNVDDSFERLDKQRFRDLLERVLGRMKPSHAKLFVKFIQEM